MADDPRFPHPAYPAGPKQYTPPLASGMQTDPVSERDAELADPPPGVELTVERRLEILEAEFRERRFGRIHQRGNPPRAGNPHVNDRGHAVNAEGRLLDAKGQEIDDEGYSLNAEGHRVDAEGRLLDDEGALIVEPKSGSTESLTGGTIHGYRASAAEIHGYRASAAEVASFNATGAIPARIQAEINAENDPRREH